MTSRNQPRQSSKAKATKSANAIATGKTVTAPRVRAKAVAGPSPQPPPVPAPPVVQVAIVGDYLMVSNLVVNGPGTIVIRFDASAAGARFFAIQSGSLRGFTWQNGPTPGNFGPPSLKKTNTEIHLVDHFLDLEKPWSFQLAAFKDGVAYCTRGGPIIINKAA